MSKKPSSKGIDPAETLQLQRVQQRMDNPNISNWAGSTNTTFDANDQANIVQTLAPRIQGITDMMTTSVEGGPAVYEPNRNTYGRGMMNEFSNNLAERSGFQMPQNNIPTYGSFQGAQPADGITQPPNIDAPQVDIGAMDNLTLPRIGDPYTSPVDPVFIPKNSTVGDKIKQFANIYSGKEKPKNPLAEALMNLGGKL